MDPWQEETDRIDQIKFSFSNAETIKFQYFYDRKTVGRLKVLGQRLGIQLVPDGRISGKVRNHCLIVAKMK
jgi:hypothetical protein